MQRIARPLIRLGLLLLLVFVLAALLPGAAQAQGAYPGGYTLMPLDPGPVRLLSLIVDVTIRDDGEQAIAEVLAVFRVHNTDKKEATTLSVAIPGYAAPKPPPEQLSLTVNGKDVPMTPGFQQWWVADIDLKPDQRRNVVLTYTVPLGSEPYVQFRYPLDLTAQVWPGVLQSARVTLGFSEPPNPQSWLRLTPEDYTLTAESASWSYDAEDPQAAIDYILMRQPVWAQLKAARQAAVAPTATSADLISLGDVYSELANSDVSALLGVDGQVLFDRYFPLAVASYSQAQTKAADDPQAYLALAHLYRSRADRSNPPDASYISLAVDQLAAALEHGAQDPAIAEAVSQDFATLIARARLQGDYDTANTYLHRLEALAANSKVNLESEALVRERRQLAIDWVQSVLQNEGPAPARTVFEQQFGAAELYPAHGRFARISSLYIDVQTDDGKRTLRIVAAPRTPGDPILQELYEALLATNVGYVVVEESQPPAIHLEIPFDTAADLQISEQRLALAIPSEPEWSLLAAILQPQTLQITETQEGWRTTVAYREDIDLVASVTQPSTEAEMLINAAAGLDTSDPFAALRAQIWRAEAEVWRRLAANNHARFSMTMHPRPGAPVERTWSAEPGERLQMNGRVVRYDLQPVLLGALVPYGLFVLVTWMLWRYQYRRRRD